MLKMTMFYQYFVNSFQIGLIDIEHEEIVPTTNTADDNVDIHAQTVHGGKDNEFTV